MSEQPPQIPPAEQPEPSSDAALEKLEEKTLEKQASSAAYRAVVEHSQHLAALNTRIDVIQAKLDKREDELHIALPRIAELEQSQRTSAVETVIESIAAGGGAIMLSAASFVPDGWLKYCLLGGGMVAAIFALLAKVLFAIWGGPPKK